jgi:D-alanyl-D-alanine carboxypeptidase (penicillin-binding protein 5/6)
MVQRGTADGLKTGHTEAGGYGLVVSSKRNGRRVILVLNGMSSMHERAEESERLMDWLFFNFEDVTLFSAGDIVDSVPVWLGTERTVPLVAGKDLIVTMPRNWRQKASIKISYDAPLRAPIAKGDPVGRLTVTGEGVPHMDVPLLAAEDVGRLGLPGRAMAVLSKYVTGT